MLRAIPKHKGTDHLQGDIKRRIKELSEELARPARGGHAAARRWSSGQRARRRSR
jgi:ribosome-interacting GTPase 1